MIRNQHVQQIAGGAVAVAIAFGGFLLERHFIGRAGIVALAVSVPLGVLCGWATIKLLEFSSRVLDE